MTLVGWVIYNGFLPGDKFYDYANMIASAAIDRGHQTILLKNNEIISLLDQISINRKSFPHYVVFTDKDTYLAKQLQLLGIRVYNSAEAIEISDDKIKTYQVLGSKQIPIPKTIFAPKTFGFQIDEQFVESVIQYFSFPLVLKEAFGSFGEQVYLVHNRDELFTQIEVIGTRPFMFQQFIQTSYGKDLRLQVVGDRVVTAMKRTSEHDFRANVTSGGKMERYKPNEIEKQLAIQATKAIGADFAGVDLLFGENNAPIVCEINSNAHIRNLLDCTGVNAAIDLVHYIEKDLGDL